MCKNEYITYMAEILLRNKPVSNIFVVTNRPIISNTDFEKHEFGKYDYKSKLGMGVSVYYTNMINGKREEIYFPSEQKLVNQVFRYLENLEIKSKIEVKICNTPIFEDTVIF